MFADVITIFAGIDRFPFFLRYGAPLRALKYKNTFYLSDTT